jgi:hypothetical protein
VPRPRSEVPRPRSEVPMTAPMRARSRIGRNRIHIVRTPQTHHDPWTREPGPAPADRIPGTNHPRAVVVRADSPGRNVPTPSGSWRVQIDVRNRVDHCRGGAIRNPDPTVVCRVDPAALRVGLGPLRLGRRGLRICPRCDLRSVLRRLGRQRWQRPMHGRLGRRAGPSRASSGRWRGPGGDCRRGRRCGCGGCGRRGGCSGSCWWSECRAPRSDGRGSGRGCRRRFAGFGRGGGRPGSLRRECRWMGGWLSRSGTRLRVLFPRTALWGDLRRCEFRGRRSGQEDDRSERKQRKRPLHHDLPAPIANRATTFECWVNAPSTTGDAGLFRDSARNVSSFLGHGTIDSTRPVRLLRVCRNCSCRPLAFQAPD